eukprot:TRINITY_DN5570_c0_g1_i1.p1 TRINITY_DN5570_c0_g1~~TRINITY_DN5570_c0_g1_i1.p1  ORF type:complete len:671 (+),score=182.64 TRINITY_DN5570_c0_g1_i1:184-2013(+)
MKFIVKKDVSRFSRGYKKLSKDTFILNPPIRPEADPSLGVYYGVSESKPIVAKCYDRQRIKFGRNLNDLFLALSGDQAKLIVNPRHRYYISPYSNAGTLKELIDDGVKYSEKEVSSFLLQVSQQLAALHDERNLYHGELTPEHILVNIEKDGDITYKICGFGHYVRKPEEYYRDESRINYLDPRIVDNPYGTYDPSCDVWSLGALCLKLVTGQFNDDLMDNPYEDLKRQEGVAVSDTLINVISRCCLEDPRFRILARNICFQPFFIPVRTKIGEYAIEKLLASGGFGDVYLTRLRNNPEQKFAAKVVKPLNKADYQQKILILGEISILLMLRDSPYIVRIIDYFEYKKQVHLMLEFFNGGDLDKYLKALKEKAMKNKDQDRFRIGIEMVEDVRMIAFNLAHALRDMHQKSIMHRDIKLPNLLIAIDERTKRLASAKLSDFGTSRELLSEGPAGTFLGTKGYLAPEILQGEYDLKIDVWAYGVVLYIIAFGLGPLDHFKQMYFNRVIKYPLNCLYQLPDSFIDLVKKCLVFLPEERYSMEDVVKHPYFLENPCLRLAQIPSYYKLHETLIQTPTFSISKAIYMPTDTNLLFKRIKAVSYTHLTLPTIYSV